MTHDFHLHLLLNVKRRFAVLLDVALHLVLQLPDLTFPSDDLPVLVSFEQLFKTAEFLLDYRLVSLDFGLNRLLSVNEHGAHTTLQFSPDKLGFDLVVLVLQLDVVYVLVVGIYHLGVLRL